MSECETNHLVSVRCNGHLYGIASYSREDAHATLVKVLKKEKKEWGEDVKYTNVTFDEW